MARQTGLSTSAVNRLVGMLKEQGYVVETDEFSDTARGRKGRLLRLNPELCTAIGVELTDVGVSGLAIDFAGHILQSVEVELVEQSPTQVKRVMIEVIRDLRAHCHRPLCGITVAAHGFVDLEEGVLVTFPGNPDWQPWPVSQELRSAFGVATNLEVRLHAAATAELYSRAGAVADPMLYFNSGPGNGFGVGIISEGRLLRGCRGLAGNFGHLVVQPQGAQCFCGSRGCLVTVASPRAIVERANDALASQVDSAIRGIEPLRFPDIAQAAQAGDKLAVQLIEDAGHYLGLGFGYFINAINPQCIVIAGTLASGGETLVSSIRRSTRQNTTSEVFNCISWELSKVDVNAAALGAAYLTFGPVLENAFSRSA